MDGALRRRFEISARPPQTWVPFAYTDVGAVRVSSSQLRKAQAALQARPRVPAQVPATKLMAQCALGNPPEPLAVPAGFEPATYRLEGECSIQLSYGTKNSGATIASSWAPGTGQRKGLSAAASGLRLQACGRAKPSIQQREPAQLAQKMTMAERVGNQLITDFQRERPCRASSRPQFGSLPSVRARGARLCAALLGRGM